MGKDNCKTRRESFGIGALILEVWRCIYMFFPRVRMFILGASGSGKTCLVKSLVGEDHHVTRGTRDTLRTTTWCPRRDQQGKHYVFENISVKFHNYSDVIMGTMASQITSHTIVYSTVYSGADQRKHQSSALLAFVWGIHRWPVNSQQKWPVTRKLFPFDDVIMMPWLPASTRHHRLLIST